MEDIFELNIINLNRIMTIQYMDCNIKTKMEFIQFENEYLYDTKYKNIFEMLKTSNKTLKFWKSLK